MTGTETSRRDATAKALAQAARQAGNREARSWAREQAAHDRAPGNWARSRQPQTPAERRRNLAKRAATHR